MSATQEVAGTPESSRAPADALAGWTVAVTAARRREELGSLLERRGARVVYAPAIRIVPLEDDAELVTATRACLAAPLDIAVATTGIGFRGWVEAADGWGLAKGLLDQLGKAQVYARGPKARGAIRAVGLREDWSPESESSSEVLAHLLAQDLAGLRIAVQLHGEPLTDVVDALRVAGAEVLTVPVYRWEPPDDLGPVERLVDDLVDGAIDCITFTSAPAAACLLQLAERQGRLDVVLSALRATLVVGVGPVTATPLVRHDVPVTMPDRARLGALARHVVRELPARSPQLRVAGHHVQVRGHGVAVDGEVLPVPPGPLAVLRELARMPGTVRTRGELGAVLPGADADEHAVEMAVTRLRAAVGDPDVVRTVVKRGYRLAIDEEKPRP